MPLFPRVPSQIDTVHLTTTGDPLGRADNAAGGQSSSQYGPFVFNGAFYWVVIYTPSGTNTPDHLSVWKSTNGNISFTEMDSSHEYTNATVFYAATFNPSNGIIYVISSITGSAPLIMHPYNCNTDTWGTDVPTSYNVSNAASGGTPLEASIKSNGDVYVFYNDNFGANFHGSKFTSGAWVGSNFSVLTPSSVSNMCSVSVDSTNAQHLVYSDGFLLRYVRLSPTDTPGTPITIFDYTSSPTGLIFSGQSAVVGNTLEVLYTDGESGIFETVGTPLSGPTFSAPVRVDTGLPTFTNLSAPTVILDQAGNVYAFYIIYNSSGGLIDQLRMSAKMMSGWGTSQIVYDEIANPPPNGIEFCPGHSHTDQFIHILSGYNIVGTFILSFALETKDPTCSGSEHCTGFVLSFSSTLPPPPGGGGGTPTVAQHCVPDNNP